MADREIMGHPLNLGKQMIDKLGKEFKIPTTKALAACTGHSSYISRFTH